jgi:dihydrofolate reductase
MGLAFILAIAENGVIGRDGHLPWRLSADLKRFKQRTMGHCLIMGRRTFDSLGRPLPGRTSIVLTRNQRPSLPAGVHAAHSVDQAVAIATAVGDTEPFVIGGAEIYALFLPLVRKLYLTRVLAQVAGDTRFELPPLDEWRLVSRAEFPADASNEFPQRDEVWERAGAAASKSTESSGALAEQPDMLRAILRDREDEKR